MGITIIEEAPQPNHRPLRALTNDELEFVRMVSERPMNIPSSLAPAAARLSSLVQEEQARR
jgi:hypothetical protein